MAHLDPAEQLLVEAAQRDPHRFADLYSLCFERVWAYVHSRVPHRPDAEDIVSEVFHDALRALPRYQWRGTPFVAWLYRIAAHAIADRARRIGRTVAQDAAPEPSAAPACPEDWDRVHQLVRRLPPEQRRVIELRFGAEQSIEQVAAALGRTTGAVKQLQFRALRTLRTRLGRAQ